MGAKVAREGKRNVTFRFEDVETPRRMQNERDKALGIVRHMMDVPVVSIRDGLTALSGPNPRPLPSTKKKVAKQVEGSLLNIDVPVDDVFHLAHLGITIVGDVNMVDDSTFEVTFTVDNDQDDDEPSDGVVNGLHTLAVFDKVLGEALVSKRQYVTFTVISGIPQRDRETLIPWIARGRNTVLQVKDQSIDNLMGLFKPFKEVLADKPYASLIGWEESAKSPYDVMDVLAILTALNPIAFPNDAAGGEEITHPVISYEKQSACLKLFEDPQRRESYRAMVPLLPEALHLYDLIRSTAVDAYNAERRQGAHLRIVEKKISPDGKATPDAWKFPFIQRRNGTYGTTGKYRLSAGATFATLAAFRVFVRPNGPNSSMRWDGGFGAVLDAWDELGEEMMLSCAETSQSLGGPNNMNAVGKHRPLWRGLHKTAKGYAAEIENRRLREQLEKARKAAVA
jgi:AIPR protein